MRIDKNRFPKDFFYNKNDAKAVNAGAYPKKESPYSNFLYEN